MTEQQKAELQALEEMGEEDIDLSDIPDRPPDWPPPKRGLFHQPVKREVTLPLDEYVIDWFEEIEPDEKARYQAINQVLVKHILDRKFSHREKSGKTAE